MISIIIPLYNKENSIRRAIESALNQTYNNIEIIVVNDCSTDNSLSICNEYADKISIITTKQNSGRPYYTRQVGIEQANGEFITFIDADDFLNNDALNKCIEMQKKTNADIVQMKISRRITNLNIPVSFKSEYDTSKAIDACLYNEYFFPIQCWGKLYRTKLIRSVTPISYSGFWGEDRIFNLPIFAATSKIQYAPSAQYNYTWGGITTSGFNIDTLQDYKQIYQIKSDWASANNYDYSLIAIRRELIKLLRYHIRQLINSKTMSQNEAINYLNKEISQSFWKDFEQNLFGLELYQREKRSFTRKIKHSISSLF